MSNFITAPRKKSNSPRALTSPGGRPAGFRRQSRAAQKKEEEETRKTLALKTQLALTAAIYNQRAF